MSAYSHPKSHRLALLSAAALGMVLAASSASAQDYDRYGAPVSYQNGSSEEVEITAPRYHGAQRGASGAPIEDVAVSRGVRYDDLDLRTASGAHALKSRIRYTAQSLCRELDVMHPITADDSPPCYRTAVEGGMEQADAAIRNAREYSDVNYRGTDDRYSDDRDSDDRGSDNRDDGYSDSH